MVIRRILNVVVGRTTVTVDEVEASARYVESPLLKVPASTWRRAARMIDRFGPEQALALLDERAERCIERRDVPSAVRWRNVMAAIHAIVADECPKDRLN